MKNSFFPIDDQAQPDVSKRSVQRFESFVPPPGAARIAIVIPRARPDNARTTEPSLMVALLPNVRAVQPAESFAVCVRGRQEFVCGAQAAGSEVDNAGMETAGV